jgi:tripartite-type tricarboxylate transporter receptor subunit TctC
LLQCTKTSANASLAVDSAELRLNGKADHVLGARLFRTHMIRGRGLGIELRLQAKTFLSTSTTIERNKREGVLTRSPHIRNLSLACLIAFACSAATAVAQTWPTRFVTLVVPFGPGSGSDTVARIIAARTSELIGQQVVVENLGGAGGLIAVSRVAKAAPDGYQVVLGAVDTFAQSQYLQKTPPYNAKTDFTPVALAVEQPLVLTVRKELPVTNLKEFAAYVKANQHKMQFGSAGIGAAPHLACLLLTSAIGATVTHVPYRSSAPALQDMIAGNLDYYCPLAVAAIPLVEGKSIKALAVLTRERSPLLPDLPTASEQGFEVVDGYYWMGLFLPKGTPEPIVTTLNSTISAALDTASVQARLRDVAATVVARERRSSAYLAKYLEDEIVKWAATMKASGITPQ